MSSSADGMNERFSKREVSESRRESPNPKLRCNFVAVYLQGQLEYALETLFLESTLASRAMCVFVVSLKA